MVLPIEKTKPSTSGFFFPFLDQNDQETIAPGSAKIVCSTLTVPGRRPGCDIPWSFRG